jgi:hypothetical protein
MDPWVRPEEAVRIYESLKGPKTLHLFRGLTHEPLSRRRPDEWRGVVAAFLEAL